MKTMKLILRTRIYDAYGSWQKTGLLGRDGRWFLGYSSNWRSHPFSKARFSGTISRKPQESASHHDFLVWIHDRLVHVHHENPDADFMRQLRAIIEAMPKEITTTQENAPHV